MGIGSGKWIARYRNKWSKAMTLAKAKQYALEMVKGIRPGRVPADPIRHVHLETLRAMGDSPVIPAPLNIMGGDRREWNHPRTIDRGAVAEILRSECPMFVDQQNPCKATITRFNATKMAIPGCRTACEGHNSASGGFRGWKLLGGL
jgi:hypothetical protein